jgi:hypothetical protein
VQVAVRLSEVRTTGEAGKSRRSADDKAGARAQHCLLAMAPRAERFARQRDRRRLNAHVPDLAQGGRRPSLVELVVLGES